MCEYKHEKQHNLFPSFSRGMKNTSHHCSQIVSVHSSTVSSCTNMYRQGLHLNGDMHRNYRSLCYQGLAGCLCFFSKWDCSAWQTLHYKQQLSSILTTEVWMMVTTLCAQTQSHEFCNCFDAFFKRAVTWMPKTHSFQFLQTANRILTISPLSHFLRHTTVLVSVI